MKEGVDPYSLSDDESIMDGSFQAVTPIQNFTITKSGKIEQFPTKWIQDREKERDRNHIGLQFYPKAKTKSSNRSFRHIMYGVRSVEDDNKVILKSYVNAKVKRINDDNRKVIKDSDNDNVTQMEERQNIPDNSVCDRGNDSSATVEVITEKLDNGDSVEKEVHGDKLVNYYLYEDGTRIKLPGFVYTTKNDLRTEFDRDESSEKRYYLNKWIPCLRNKKLYIEGDLRNFDSDMNSGWTTSQIVSRISDKQVGTRNTCYVLEGQLAIPAQGEHPIPLFVMDKFRNGFPENWKDVIEHWIHFNEQSLVTQATNKTILKNISSISKTSTVVADPSVSTVSSMESHVKVNTQEREGVTV